MRAVLYLGTRGCPPTLTDALEGYHDPLLILVPAEPQLMGPNLDDDTLAAGLEDVARILASRALEDAIGTARKEDQALADVFGQTPQDPRQRIESRVLDGGLADGLERVLDEHPDLGAVYVARDTLDVLDGAAIRPSDVLERHDVELVAR